MGTETRQESQWNGQELAEVARWQKWIIWLILCQILLVVTLVATAAAVPKPEEAGTAAAAAGALMLLITLVRVVLVVLSIYGVYKMAQALHYSIAWLYAVLMIVPLVGLICLLVLNSKATNVLTTNGVRVGFMGADAADLERAKANDPGGP